MATGATLIPRRASTSNRAASSRQTQAWRRNQQNSSAVTSPRLREGPSFFDSASNVGIHGGHFTAHHAPQASVTVNITHGSAGDGNPSVNQENHSRGNSDNSDSGQGRLHVSESNSNEQHESQLRPAQRSNVLYEQHLLHKGRGHPLWIPQPNMRLPISYRKKGVCIGDVGIITPDGAFDFLFNICLNTDDPIHSDELPDNFAPLNPPLSRTDIREFREFTYGSYLASSSVVRVQSIHQDARALAFESSASEGAILTMPAGAYVQELNNISRFRDYLSVHAENWYKFVNGPRGREAKNGDLRLVVGCDKSNSWGMAVFANVSRSRQTNFHLEFNGRVDEHGQVVPGNLYDWHHSGTAEVRVGPDPEENEELTAAGEPTTHTLRNQCLFIRTLNVTLSAELWENMFPKSDVGQSLESFSSSANPSKSPELSGASKSMHKSGGPPPQKSIEEGKEPPLQDLMAPPTNQSSGVIITSSPSFLSTVHPAKVLSDFLFERFPEAKMTITHDRSWYLPLKKIGPTYSPVELIAHMCESNDTRFQNGIAYLEPIEEAISHSLGVMQFSRLIDGHISVKEYLFGPDDNPELIFDHISWIMDRFYFDNLPLKHLVGPSHSVIFSPDFEDILNLILREMLAGGPQVVYQEEHGHHPIASELPGHPHFFLPLSRASFVAAKHRQNVRFDHIAEAVSFERIELLRLQVNQHQLNPPPYFYTNNLAYIEILQRLAGALYRRYMALRDKEDLDEAISYYEEICKSTKASSSPHLEGLLGLCTSLYQRLILLGMFQDFVDLVKGLKAENALDLIPILHPIIDELRKPSEIPPYPSSVSNFTPTDFTEAKSKPLTLPIAGKDEYMPARKRDPDASQKSSGNISAYDKLTPSTGKSAKFLDTTSLDNKSFQNTHGPWYTHHGTST